MRTSMINKFYRFIINLTVITQYNNFVIMQNFYKSTKD